MYTQSEGKLRNLAKLITEVRKDLCFESLSIAMLSLDVNKISITRNLAHWK